jgi:hypothetical protein
MTGGSSHFGALAALFRHRRHPQFAQSGLLDSAYGWWCERKPSCHVDNLVLPVPDTKAQPDNSFFVRCELPKKGVCLFHDGHSPPT